MSAHIELKNPLILALDVDSAEKCFEMVQKLAGHLGAIKIGPRLAVRYGATLISEIAKICPVFVDNKYLDIPNTMEAAIRATFEAGATFATVHAWSGGEALRRLAKVESDLNRIRPFKILNVTVLTSFSEETLPPGFLAQALERHVTELAQLVLESGLDGIVCSPKEVALIRTLSASAFLVTPGVRMAGDAHGDQKRVETPEAAMRAGASALVVGRPIYESKDPIETVERILSSVRGAKA